MKIQNVGVRPYFYNSKKSKNVGNAVKENKMYGQFASDKVSFGSINKSMCYSRICNPAQEAIEKEEYRQKLLSAYFSKAYDKSGNPVVCPDGEVKTELDKSIVDKLDKSNFEFELPMGQGVFRGPIKQAIINFMVSDDRLPDGFCGVLHGTSKENLASILSHGPNLRNARNTAFGPGMYFALCEADAQDYSPAKLKADVVRAEHANGQRGKFVRLNECFYNKITTPEVYNALDKILDIEPEPTEYDPLRPSYIPTVKYEIPTRVLDEYCRNIINNDLGIDVAYATAPYHNTCLVVFNPDSIVNMSDYSQDEDDFLKKAFSSFPLW